MNQESLKDKKKFLYYRQGGTCRAEGCQENRFHKLTIDHIVPRAEGKRLGWGFRKIHHIQNLQLLCRFHHDLKDFPKANKPKLYKRYGFDYVEFNV